MKPIRPPIVTMVAAPKRSADPSPLHAVVPATALARRLGLRTGTLGKWRRLGKGPGGWYYQSNTRVVYPLAEIESFEAGRKAARPSFSSPPPSFQRNHAASMVRSEGV